MASEDDPWYEPGKLGLVFSVQLGDDGTVTLLVGDVKRESGTLWRHEAEVARKELDRADFFEVEVAEDILADVGLLVLSRLAARMGGEGARDG